MRKRLFAALMATLMLIGAIAMRTTVYADSGTNTNRNAADVISVNQEVSGRFEDNKTSRWYKFTLSSPGKLDIYYNLSNADPRMTMKLYQDSTRIDYWDLESGRYAFPLTTIAYRLPAGDYYIEMSPYYSNPSTNQYTLKVNFTAEGDTGHEIEYNNNRNTANTLDPNATVIGNASNNSDEDWYKVVIPNNGKISISYNLQGEDPRTTMKLYKDAERLDYWDLESGKYAFPYTTHNIRIPAGTYYIQLAPYYSNPSNKDYTLKLNYTDESSGNYEVEFNNDRNTANQIQLNQTYVGNATDNRDTDWFKFNITSPTDVTLTYNLVGSDPRTTLKLYQDATRKQYWELDASRYSFPYKTDPLTLQPGNYYIELAPYYSNASNADYSISVNTSGNVPQLPEPTPTPVPEPTPTPPPVSSGTQVGGFSSEAVNVGAKLWWNPISGGVGYRVYRSETSGVEGISVTDFYITSNEFIDVNVDANKTYYYTVRQVIKEAKPFEGLPEELGPASAQITVRTSGEILGGNASDSIARKRFILMTLDDAYMSIDGVRQEIDPGRGTVPLIVNSRTMVPIRAIVEGMGGSVGWDDASRRIALGYSGKQVQMWLDNRQITVGGQYVTIDVAPKSINGRTMVPIRFAAENLGCQVDWINSTRQIVIVFR